MKFNIYLKKIACVAVGITMSMASCKKYVEVDPAPNLLSVAATFSSDASATSAVLSLYSYYPSTYCLQYFTFLGGVSSDELQYNSTTAEIQQFAQNTVANVNGINESYLWTYPYQVIGYATRAIDGVTSSTGVSAATKNQLIGEAKFIRAFVFFNMVNYFGGLPLSLDPSTLNNGSLPRATTAAVYAQIIADLKDAEAKLPATYAGTAALKVRVNKWAAAALLAKVYLYNKDYVNAEAEATEVIGSNVYSMATLSNAFLNTSSETILQFSTLYGYSTVGTSFRTASSAATVAPPTYSLFSTFAKSFENGDGRKTSWVDSTTYNNIKYYRIYKYKLATATAGNEYNVVLRLAEQYLIRAEARAQQGNVNGSQTDLNVVRTRAGLAGTTAATQTDLLTAIAKERKVELFGEYGNRWFDLKRTGTVDAVMGAAKTTWKSTAALMPIPYNQILLNTSLTQNPGY